MTSTAEETTAVAVAEKRPTFLVALEKYVPQFSDFLPVGVRPERVIASVRMAVANNAKIAECTPASIIQSVGRAMQLDLEIGVDAYLIPRNVWNPNTKQKEMTCTMLPDYRAHIQMIVRSGAARAVEADVVRDGDFFEYERGLEKKLRHVPNSTSDAPITHAYAIVRLRGGLSDFIVMTRQEIEAVRSKSQGWNDEALEKKREKVGLDAHPWYAKKCVVIRVTNLVPKNPRLAERLALIDRTMDGEGEVVAESHRLPTPLRAPMGETGYGEDVERGEMAG